MRPSVQLNQNLDDVIRCGHPWLYADALNAHDDLRDGTVVDVFNQDWEWIARGIYEPESPIRVRIWTLDEEEQVNNQLLEKRIKAALKAKPFPNHETTGFRLLNGEGDRTPGVTCDVYDNVAVFRIDGLAAERWLAPAARIIKKVLPIEHVAVRRSELYRGDNPAATWFEGGLDEVEFLEHGVRFLADPINGQKTGFFLDQRTNRQHLAELSQGRRLLNLFGYNGGFSIVAACNGAAKTTTVDLAKPALKDARRIFELNGIPAAAHDFEAADVFDYLNQFGAGKAPFDVVVCDPPSFAHKRGDLQRATESYINLFGRVMEVMPSGSKVALASCSSHIDRTRFLDIVAQASARVSRPYVMYGLWGAALDHSVLPGFPQGDYLQFVSGALE